MKTGNGSCDVSGIRRVYACRCDDRRSAISAGGGGAGAAQSVPDLLKDPAVKAALDAAKATEAQTIEDQIRFCEVPAPPFKETARGEVLRQTFQQLGLQNVRVDKAGNVLGDRPGAAAHPHLVLAAHLDTVFPEGTDVKVKRDGAVLQGRASATTAAVWPCWSPSSAR